MNYSVEQSAARYLRDIRKSRAMSLGEFGDLVGEDASLISRVERGEVRLTLERFVQYCTALGLQPRTVLSELHGDSGAVLDSSIPVVPLDKVRDWPNVSNIKEHVGQPLLDLHADYVVQQLGDSMTVPDGSGIADGDYVWVVSRAKPKHNDDVVILRDQGGAAIRRYIYDGTHAWARARNPAWPEPHIAIEDPARIVGRVIFKGRK